ncbi:protein kinase [Streptomyces sp. NPDC059385]|uniref:protein kinase domain-containing protein n=1 Tax=Streptomyces sp. NPDC059385 TaxID=3346817 RepID=UPI00369C1B46
MGDVFAQGVALAGGRYRIDGLLGEGGMAQVYKAYDAKLARAVAIKTMLPGLAHPNVVTVHDTGEEPLPDGPPVPYFVMELVTGPSLADRLRTGGALPVPAAVDVADQVLNALGASHEQDLVHRDIKPSNVLPAGGGVAKVADFGIVRAITGPETVLTGTGMMVGTAHYMSPEQARGLPLDGRSDLYAVGVLLFEMLTGRLPFGGADVFAIALRHVSEPPPTPASYGLPGLPGLEAVPARALAKRPEDRYPDAATMRTALRAAAGTVADAAAGAAAGSFVPAGPAAVAAVPTVSAPARAAVPVVAPPQPVLSPPPTPMPSRARVRLGACALLGALAFGFVLVAEADGVLWMAYVAAGIGAGGALGSLPARPRRSGPPPSPRYRVVFWVVLGLNLYALLTGCVGTVVIKGGAEDQATPSRSFSAMRITHTATATSSAASASSRTTSTA